MYHCGEGQLKMEQSRSLYRRGKGRWYWYSPHPMIRRKSGGRMIDNPLGMKFHWLRTFTHEHITVLKCQSHRMHPRSQKHSKYWTFFLVKYYIRLSKFEIWHFLGAVEACVSVWMMDRFARLTKWWAVASIATLHVAELVLENFLVSHDVSDTRLLMTAYIWHPRPL